MADNPPMTMNRPNLPIPPRRLLVADSLVARKVMGALLRKAGYEVVEAESGQDALQKIRSTMPDLVVLNVELSDQSGLDVLRAIRGDAALEHVPVVLLSQLRVSPEEQVEGLDAGAEGYIAGPIANAELLARLRVYVRQGDLLNQLSASEKRFRDLLEHQTDGVVVVDKESGVVCFANAAAEKFLGGPPNRLEGRPFGFHVECGGISVLTVPQPAGHSIFLEARCAPTVWDNQPSRILTLNDVTERSRAAAALAESEGRYRLLFESNPLPQWVHDQETRRFLAVNAAAVARYGYSREEFLGLTIQDIRPPEDTAAVVDVVRGISPETNPVGIWRHRTKDGTLFRAEVFEHPIHYGGRPAVLVLAQDVSKRLRAEESLRDNEAFQRIAFRMGKIGTWSVDLPAMTYRWSDSVREIFELSMDVHPDFMDLFGYFVAEDRAAARSAFDACMRDGTSYMFEAGFCTALGRQRWVRVTGEAVRDPQGVILLVQGAFQDVSERKLAEQSLIEIQRRFRVLADSLPFIVWTAEPDGTVDYNNAQFFNYTGTAAEAPAATRWQPCVHPDDLAECLRIWTQCAQSEMPYEIEYRLRRGADGTYRWFRVQAQPERDGSGRLIKWYGTAIDIHEIKRLEQVASRLARRLTTTLESLTDAFFTVDRDRRFTYINAKAVSLLGRSRADMLGRDMRDFVPAAADGLFERQFRRAEVKNIPVSLVEYFVPPATWVEVRMYPSEDGMAFIFRDITRRRLDSEQLRLQQAALEAASDSISVTNRAGLLQWVNPAFAERYGYTREECVGHTPGSLIKSGRQDQAFYRSMWKTILAGEVWSSEIINRRRDGGMVTEEIAINPIRGANGRVTHFIAIKRDITRRKREAETLLEQAALLDKAKDAITVRDLEHRVTYWNKSAERLYGWSVAEAVGRVVTELLYRDPKAFLAATAATLKEGEWNGELDHYTRTGRKLTVASSWTLVRDESGQPKSIFVISTDVTEKKKLEAQFLRAQRLESIGTLAGGIAHDLNNVLAPILISIDLFRIDETNPERLDLLRSIEKSAQHGAELVRQVLSFARGMEGDFVELDLRHIARDLQQILRDTFPKNIDFALKSARDLWTVRADATQVHQVLMNLFVNARDAMPGGGRLTLALENIVIDDANMSVNPDAKVGPFVVMQVEDTGAGIPPEIRERIFDPFFTTKEVGKGTGLGLATVLTIVKGHGGFIDVHSVPGKGSKFSVYLPVGSAAGPAEVAAAENKRLPQGNGELVLLADDEESVRYVTRKTLERFGYRVILASNGAEAVALYARHRPDVAVVLIDMAMPIMDGPAAIVALRSINPEVKIVCSSGHVSNGDVTKALGAGGQHFVSKPYTAEALLKVLAQALGKPDSKPPFPFSVR